MTSEYPIYYVKILQHWREFHQKMFAQMEQAGRLEAAAEATAMQIHDLMYDLVNVQGMEWSAAWEIALDQHFLPAEADEPDPTNQNQQHNFPETSE